MNTNDNDFVLVEKMVDMEEFFFTIPPEQRVLINDLDYMNANHKARVPMMIKNTINDDKVDLNPSCLCSNLNSFSHIGAICKVCNSPVQDLFANFEPTLWLRSMEGLPKFISPMFLLELDKVANLQVIGKEEFSFVRWFGDRTYNPDLKASSKVVIDVFRNDPHTERTYTWFYNNIRKIIILLDTYNSSKIKSQKLKRLLAIYEKNIDIIQTDYLPFPHKRFIIHESNSLGSYIQGSLPYLLSAALLFMKSKDEPDSVYKERSIARVLSFLTKAYVNIISDFFSRKEGLYRKNMFGLRSDFSLRSVIVPIEGKHHYNHVYLPWKASVVLLKYHITNILYNRYEMEMNEILDILLMAEVSYSSLVDEVMKILIKEAGGSLTMTIQRNPSQNNGGTLLIDIPKIKTDIDDETISMSPLAMPSMNADVDGDQVNMGLPLDNYHIELLEPYRLVNTTSSLSPNPSVIFPKVGITDPVALTMTNLIAEERRSMNEGD